MDNRIVAERDQKLDEFRQVIAHGVAQADQGLMRVFDEATLTRIKAEAKARFKKTNGRIPSSAP